MHRACTAPDALFGIESWKQWHKRLGRLKLTIPQVSFWSFPLLVDCQPRLKDSNYPLQFSSQENLLLVIRIIDSAHDKQIGKGLMQDCLISFQSPLLHSGEIYGFLQI